MTIDEMFNELENKARDIFIVTLKYKYDFEENYTIENQILDYNSIDDSYVWLNDWYEGQTDIEVLGYMILGDVDTTKLLTYEDCISRQMAIDAIKNIHPVDTEYDCTLYDKLDVMYVLKDLPSVTPIRENDLDEKMKEYKLGFQDGTPLHEGRWVQNWCEWQQYLECSNCGYETGLRCDTNFCPHCGARMKGVD